MKTNAFIKRCAPIVSEWAWSVAQLQLFGTSAPQLELTLVLLLEKSLLSLDSQWSLSPCAHKPGTWLTGLVLRPSCASLANGTKLPHCCSGCHSMIVGPEPHSLLGGSCMAFLRRQERSRAGVRQKRSRAGVWQKGPCKMEEWTGKLKPFRHLAPFKLKNPTFSRKV